MVIRTIIIIIIIIVIIKTITFIIKADQIKKIQVKVF